MIGSPPADRTETKPELQRRTRYEVRIRRLDGKETSRTFRTEADATQREQLEPAPGAAWSTLGLGGSRLMSG